MINSEPGSLARTLQAWNKENPLSHVETELLCTFAQVHLSSLEPDPQIPLQADAANELQRSKV